MAWKLHHKVPGTLQSLRPLRQAREHRAGHSTAPNGAGREALFSQTPGWLLVPLVSPHQEAVPWFTAPELPLGSCQRRDQEPTTYSIFCFDNGDRRKGCPTQKPQDKTCSLFMFLPQLLKESLWPEPRRRKEQTNAPPQGRTSPRWCSCSGWRARTPRRCQGSPCWSTCPLGAQVSTSTGAVKEKGEPHECQMCNCGADGRAPH